MIEVVHADASGVYGLLGDAGVFASVVTRLFHSAAVIDRSWGSSAAAITSLRKLVSTTNSSAAFDLAASSSFASSVWRHSVVGVLPEDKYDSASNPDSAIADRSFAKGRASWSAGD